MVGMKSDMGGSAAMLSAYEAAVALGTTQRLHLGVPRRERHRPGRLPQRRRAEAVQRQDRGDQQHGRGGAEEDGVAHEKVLSCRRRRSSWTWPRSPARSS